MRRPQSVTVELLETDIINLRLALLVIVLTPSISNWLEKNHPKALAQAHKALDETESAL